MPKAAKRRVADAATGDAAAASTSSGGGKTFQTDSRPPRGEGNRDRTRGPGFGGRGGRGGRGRGGRGFVPSGRVAFVGTLSEGSSFSSSGGASSGFAPSTGVKQSGAAADGVGISVLDDDIDMDRRVKEDLELKQQWPPVIKSNMQPMELPFARQPEPENAAAVFCDAMGQPVLPDDSLLFLQLPTTLPLSKVARVSSASEESVVKQEKQEPGASASLSTGQERSIHTTTQKVEETGNGDQNGSDTYDKSLDTAPGGFIGKVRCLFLFFFFLLFIKVDALKCVVFILFFY